MVKRSFLIGLSVLLLVLPLTAFAIDIPAKIYENGQDNNPVAVPGVNVEVFGGDRFEALLSSGVSGGDGGCLLGRVPFGKEVIVKLTKEGYIPQYDVRSYSETDVNNGVILWIGSETNVASLYKNLGAVFDVKKGQGYLEIDNESTGEGIEGVQLGVSSGKVFDLGHGEYLIANAGGAILNVGIRKPGFPSSIESVTIPLFPGAMTQYYANIGTAGGVADFKGSSTTAAGFDFAPFAGNWSGQWTNTTFATTGPISMVISVNTAMQTFQITVTLGGEVFGSSPPPPQVISGSYTASGATINTTSPFLGNVSVTISPTGALNGSVTSLPNASISRVDFTGTAVPPLMTINYTIQFTAAAGGGTASGSATLNQAASVTMSVAPASIDFGSVTDGQSSDKTFTITNQPSSPANLTGSVGTPAPPFSVVSGGGAFNLAPGQSLTVTVRFSPTAAGAASTNLSITHNATNMNNPANIPLTGTGVSTNTKVPKISVTPATFGYKNVKVNKSKTASFKVKNTGTADLVFTPEITGADASMFTITSGSGTQTIKPRKTFTLKVTFKPTSKGSKSANLEITSNDPNTPKVDIPLTGTGQ